ncbi:hypothetical protein BDV26DRAFT_272705 [Aspergillus bertholletiae]|uniref:Chromatin modification-related protein n=1 Tax=Aspergillus bertholletiae TaxID=1226010 RepID=A0A5N7ATH9_9EURO|nr:hypothetical protein BDV26DRAFT_272705 [Aspergillus bertholletiae]
MMADYDEDDVGGVILDGPFDPDAQATVTDFIDYTEYLPADIIRSLTLIRGLDERYLEATQGVHGLTKTYGQLPELPPDGRPDARKLRKDISSQLDRAVNARESAYAEACRLYDVVDRHFNRLDCIKQKLEALPKPPPAEPTALQTVPVTKRGRPTKKGDDVVAPTTRITLRLDSHDNTKSASTLKSRTRRSVLSVEHLAGLHPDSPIASTEHSDVEEPKAIPSEPHTNSTVAQGRKEKQGRRSRTSLGTHAHSGVANISTSNALAMLKPPPEDAKPGSEDMPWLRLTEWEMTKLRKKMKKNAVWQPSEVMIHRELALRGRGWEAYRAAKAQAEANGSEFIDCDDIMNNYIPGKLTKRSEATKDTEGTFETKLSNRGMKLNEAKKLKRENQAREQAAAAAAEAELAAKRQGQGQGVSPVKVPVHKGDQALAGKPSRAAKKRKPDESPLIDPTTITTTTTTATTTLVAGTETRVALRSPSKRRKTSDTPMESSVSVPSASTTTPSANVPTAVAEVTETQPTPPPASPAGSKRSVPPSGAVVAPPTSEGIITTTPPVTRTPSRRRSTAASAEPVSSVGLITVGRELRRKSATPARKTPVPDVSRAASLSAPRRKKRPAPGPVSSGQDGGAAVSYGRRKAKPGKKRFREHGPKDGDIRIDEDGVLEEIDPNEPRYCLCGDVSFGTMICCENNDCDREWFHLDCVGLSEVPSRTAKWYCPECRVRFNKGSDGIVKIGLRR